MLTLRHRLLIAMVAVQVVVLLLLLAAGFRSTRDALVAEARGNAVTVQQLLAVAIGPLVAARDYGAVREAVQDNAASAQLAYLVLFDADGRELARAGNVPAPGSVRPVDPRQTSPHEDGGVFHVAAPLVFEKSDYGRMQFGVSAARMHDVERAVLLQTAAISAAGLAISVALLLVLSGVLTSGLSRLARATERLGAGEHDVALPVHGGDEVARLSAAFNRMSHALDERVAALRESETRQRSLVEGLAAGVLFFDNEHRIRDCNEAACRILGLPREELIGRSVLEEAPEAMTLDGAPVQPVAYATTRALATGEPQRDVLRGLTVADGRRRWLSVNSQPLHHAGAALPYATVTSFTDVTPLIEAEQRLTQLNAELERRVAERTADLAAARDAAERANRAKSEFLSRMSHELRTPLNAILGFAQILQMRTWPDDAREQLRQIETAGWHLLQLINEVLDLSRIESGVMTVVREAVDVQRLVAESVSLATALAQTSGVRLDNRATAPLAALGDAMRLRQVLMNLLSNAIKYNRAGGSVTVTARRNGEPARIELAVADTGRGFSEEQLRSLYQPFNRLGADAAGVEGTGIGLVVTRRLVELMGGTLELQTKLGEGSVFTVVLPAADEEAAPAAAAAPPAAPPAEPPVAPPTATRDTRKVLYIEDNPSNVDVLANVLTLRPGLSLLSAQDGPSGFALARAENPDLIVIDIGLPGPDGFEVCRWLRADAALAQRPIVALSANAMPADVERGRAAGFDVYLTKPVDVPVFLAEIDRLLERTGVTS